MTLGAAAAALPAASGAAVASRKKGYACGGGGADLGRRLTALRVSWFYNWCPNVGPGTPGGVEFVPMISKYRGTQPDAHIQRLTVAGGAARPLLGFNEPDHTDQANMSVAQAIESWPVLMGTGLRLGAPAAANPEGAWMRAFMKEIAARKYRVDFIPVHCYPDPDGVAFLARLQRIHAAYGRPLWITEFAVADWSAKAGKQPRFNAAMTLQFMRAVLPRLNTLHYLERYSWFSASLKSPIMGCSALFDEHGALTKAGEYYASV